jgi:hypothetical protein
MNWNQYYHIFGGKKLSKRKIEISPPGRVVQTLSIIITIIFIFGMMTPRLYWFMSQQRQELNNEVFLPLQLAQTSNNPEITKIHLQEILMGFDKLGLNLSSKTGFVWTTSRDSLAATYNMIDTTIDQCDYMIRWKDTLITDDLATEVGNDIYNMKIHNIQGAIYDISTDTIYNAYIIQEYGVGGVFLINSDCFWALCVVMIVVALPLLIMLGDNEVTVANQIDNGSVHYFSSDKKYNAAWWWIIKHFHFFWRNQKNAQ